MMDTSEKYILMCEKAEEIQKQFDPTLIGKYNFIYIEWEGGFHGVCINHERLRSIAPPERTVIWLPRPDQLWRMVEAIDENNVHRLFRFNRFIEEHDYLPMTHQCPYIYFINLTDREDIEEILWLAFIMHEKYQKQWLEYMQDWKEEPMAK